MDANDMRRAGIWLTDAQSDIDGEFQARIRDLIAYRTANRACPNAEFFNASISPPNGRSCRSPADLAK